eukprot:6443014-Prymnesium_polylepis.1
MHVGCFRDESGSFWDGGRRPELRGTSQAYILALDTHGTATQWPHLMAASQGPVPPIFGPPPTPDLLRTCCQQGRARRPRLLDRLQE